MINLAFQKIKKRPIYGQSYLLIRVYRMGKQTLVAKQMVMRVVFMKVSEFSFMMEQRTGGAAMAQRRRRQWAIRADRTAKYSICLIRRTTRRLASIAIQTATAGGSWKSAITCLWPIKKSLRVNLNHSLSQTLTMDLG